MSIQSKLRKSIQKEYERLRKLEAQQTEALAQTRREIKVLQRSCSHIAAIFDQVVIAEGISVPGMTCPDCHYSVIDLRGDTGIKRVGRPAGSRNKTKKQVETATEEE